MYASYIHEYYQKLKNGSEIASKWVLLLYEKIINGLENKIFFYDAKKANKAVRFIETFCHHCKGRNDLLKLELWQKAFITCLFGIVDNDNMRQFREAFVTMGRKNGKSAIATAIMVYMSFADGEYGGELYCVAPKLDQADIIYKSFWETIKSEKDLANITRSRKSDYYIENTNTTIKKIAFNAKKSDGFNPSLVICDEVASWPGDAGLKQYDVMASACGARKQPLLLAISTAGYINGGIYDNLFTRATRFLLGDSKETRFLPLLYCIDNIEKWDDLNEIAKANPNIGVSIKTDYLLEQLAIAAGDLAAKAEFLTKFCCIKQNSSTAWLPAKIIEAASGGAVNMADYQKNYCVAGIDLSMTTDLTSACIVIEKNGILNVIWHFWLPGEKLAEAITRDGLPYDAYIERGFLSLAGDNFVDYQAVYNWIIEAIEKYKLLPLITGYDRYSSNYLIKDLENYGCKCDDVFQGYNLTGVIREAEGLLKDGKINIGNNDLAKIHLLDTAIEADNRNNRVRIKKVNRQCHIDGTAALLCALTVRQKWYNDLGGRLSNNRR